MADTRVGKTLRLQPELWRRLKELAIAHHRSVTQEVAVILEKAAREKEA
jgi:plasmid stability protein